MVMSRAIYAPSGKAGEYADHALNIYTGCNHGCTYCYAPGVVHRNREDFHAVIKPREGLLDVLRKEASEYKGKKIFLCFTSDPYTVIDGVAGPITREVIEILRDAGCGVEVLSKAGLVCTRDFDLLEDTKIPSAFGTTLTTLDADKAKEWEPEAATPFDRCGALEDAYMSDIDTFASLEPVICPEDTLDIIRKIHPYTNRIKIGRWNYDERAKDINWRKFAEDVVALCEELGVDYYIKKDLAVFLEADPTGKPEGE